MTKEKLIELHNSPIIKKLLEPILGADSVYVSKEECSQTFSQAFDAIQENADDAEKIKEMTIQLIGELMDCSDVLVAEVIRLTPQPLSRESIEKSLKEAGWKEAAVSWVKLIGKNMCFIEVNDKEIIFNSDMERWPVIPISLLTPDLFEALIGCNT